MSSAPISTSISITKRKKQKEFEREELSREQLIRDADQNCMDIADQLEEQEKVVQHLKSAFKRALEDDDKKEMIKVKSLLHDAQVHLKKLQEVENECMQILDSLYE